MCSCKREGQGRESCRGREREEGRDGVVGKKESGERRRGWHGGKYRQGESMVIARFKGGADRRDLVQQQQQLLNCSGELNEHTAEEEQKIKHLVQRKR